MTEQASLSIAFGDPDRRRLSTLRGRCPDWPAQGRSPLLPGPDTGSTPLRQVMPLAAIAWAVRGADVTEAVDAHA